MKCAPPPLSLSLSRFFRRAAGARSPSTFSPYLNLNPNPFRMPRWVGVARPRAKAIGPKAPVAGKELGVSGECSFESFISWVCDCLGFCQLSMRFFVVYEIAASFALFGSACDGACVGSCVGANSGLVVGMCDGSLVGGSVGAWLGLDEGSGEGGSVGSCEGTGAGTSEGNGVGP
jgi:hypothetical protein